MEESERASTIISIFTDDEDDDFESTQEGWDPNNTTFKLPSDDNNTSVDQVPDDPFAAIMKDLDEKAQELEQKKSDKKKKIKQKKQKQNQTKKSKNKTKTKPKHKHNANPVDPVSNPNANANPKPPAHVQSPMSPKPLLLRYNRKRSKCISYS